VTSSDHARNPRQLPHGSLQPQLLPGENPDTDLFDDVTHWVRVYTELIDSGRGLMDGGRDPAPGVDSHLVQAHLQRLDGRLDFWLQKRARLTR
jgi:hypothetical protein